jgi:hypothetical protein
MTDTLYNMHAMQRSQWQNERSPRDVKLIRSASTPTTTERRNDSLIQIKHESNTTGNEGMSISRKQEEQRSD